MFNPFIWLDNILRGAAQKLCDKVQQLTGLTKFAFEKWALISAMIFFWGCCFLSKDIPLAGVLLFISSLVVFMVRYIEKQEAEFLKNGTLEAPLFRMPFRIIVLFVIGSFAFKEFLSADYASKIASYGHVSYILWAYFGSCVPRPPSKSKARERYENGLTWLNDHLKPSPVPTS